jgi:hypothetical protein
LPHKKIKISRGLSVDPFSRGLSAKRGISRGLKYFPRGLNAKNRHFKRANTKKGLFTRACKNTVATLIKHSK